MTSCRIERKRAHDREAQRASRAKTKAYIAHLEKTVADLTQSSGDNRANYLAQHASKQQGEIDNLQALVTKIRALVQDATKTEQESSQSPQDSDVRMKIEGLNGNEETNGEAFSASWESPISEEDWAELVKPVTAKPVERKEPAAKSPSSPRNMVVLGVSMVCEDDDDCSYFTRLNKAVTKVEQMPDNLSTLEEDEDILVRAIIHGWDAAERAHHFDIVWRFLRAFDEGLWFRAAPMERFANVWQMRSTMLHKIEPKNQPRRHTAPFMAPTAGQQSWVKRPPIIDYFAWPQVRNHLLAQGVTKTPSKAAIAFAESFQFVWPYELRDVYKINRSTRLYSLSEGFLKNFNDLSCFRMLQNDDIPYYVHPTLAQATAPPPLDSIVECESSDGSENGDMPASSTDGTAVPSVEGLMQEAVDASWLPSCSMDIAGDLTQYLDPFVTSYESSLSQWPGL